MGRPQFEQVVGQIPPKAVQYITGVVKPYLTGLQTYEITINAPLNTLCYVNALKFKWYGNNTSGGEKMVKVFQNGIPYLKVLANATHLLNYEFVQYSGTKEGFDFLNNNMVITHIAPTETINAMNSIRSIVFDEVNPLKIQLSFNSGTYSINDNFEYEIQLIVEEAKDVGVYN